MLSLKVNGKVHNVDAEPETPLLWVLRDTIGLTGTKYGCGAGLCGACTIHVNGRAVRSCTLPAGKAEGQAITTIEGLGGQHPLQTAWAENSVPACGYCQSGQIMAAAALLKHANDLPELPSALRIKARGGLIEEKNFRRSYQRGCDRQPLPLAA